MIVHRKQVVTLFVASLLLAGGISAATWLLEPNDSKQSSTEPLPSLVDETTLATFATIDTPIDQSHIAPGLTPPTNKWFSGFALQADPKPGYNYPTTFLPRKTGFEFGLPKIQVTSTSMSGVHTPAITVSIASAVSYKITAYDELVVELTYYDTNQEAVAEVHVASGLPYVYIRAAKDTSLQFNGAATSEGSWTHIQGTSGQYGVNVPTDDNRLTLAQGSTASFFGAPHEKALGTVARYSNVFVESGHVSYAHQDEQFTTTFTYNTTDGQPVLFARLPHQNRGDTSGITYQSILGDMSAETGTVFSFETPAIPAVTTLDIATISHEQKELLSRQLARDVTSFEHRTDTYFGGKQLYRMAQLLTLSHQLNDSDAAATAQTTLRRALDSWLTLGKTKPQSFLYDPAVKGIVGNEASFGSDKEFNDHHFHYGYFIYAAAILAEYDATFLDAHQQTINLLVADIANYNTDEKLPLRRSFDPYAGHSWASGTVPFRDGNNQESTSEAINAWVGVSLWADQTNNNALKLEADWMTSLEYQTAQHYWLLQSPLPDYLSSYTSPLVSIVWGGKREYATFFSDEANAKLAIQLLPLSPTMKRHLTPLPKDLLSGTSTTRTYGDTILMATPGASLEEAIRLPDSAIDDGNSRTYMYAYILAK